MSEVRIFKASLEDDDETDQIIIRGVLDQECLKYIKLDWYQREQGFSNNHTNKIVAAFISGNKIEDITVGMRGARMRTSKDGTYTLLDKCYCINGGQRLWSAACAIKERPDLKIRLGIKVYTNTNEQFENDLFCKMGTSQVKIGPSILLRNRRKNSRASAMLLAICKDPVFAMKDRIAWDQRKTRQDLMQGFTFARVVGALHCHKGGALRSSVPYDLLDGLDSLVERIGEEAVTGNIIRFFDGIDKCWTIRQLSGDRSEQRLHLTLPFLLTVGRLFSAYSEFWDGTARNDFYLPDKYLRRLKGLTLNDYIMPRAKVPRDAFYEILRKRLQLNPIFEQEAAE